jgi:hypothetical protein
MTPPKTTVQITGEPHSAWLRVPKPGSKGETQNVEGVTSASVRVRVDETSPEGLNFFALQLSFDNGTWAHGGVQLHEGTRHEVNFGGLPPLPGDDDDYGERTHEQLRDGLELIQNAPNQNDSLEWEPGQTYVYAIERSEQPVTVPPGSYALGDGEDRVRVDHSREMYEWTFTITPEGSDDPIYESTMLNSSATASDLVVWNESGYGSHPDELTTTWSDPVVTTVDDPTPTPVTMQQYLPDEPERRPTHGPF